MLQRWALSARPKHHRSLQTQTQHLTARDDNRPEALDDEQVFQVDHTARAPRPTVETQCRREVTRRVEVARVAA